MKRSRWVGTLVLVSAVALGLTAYGGQAGDKPAWKGFADEKSPFWQEMETTTTQTMKVSGQEVVQKQQQTFIVKWTPKKKLSDKSWEVEYEIVAVKMDIQIGGNNISYDSRAKDKPPQNPLTDFFQTLVGSKFTLTIGPDDKNDKRKGAIRVLSVDTKELEVFVNKLAAANEQLKPLLKNILSADAIKEMSNPTFDAFPTDEEFKAGKWTSEITLNMGPIGSYKTTYTYTPDAKDKGKIGVTSAMVYSPPKDDKSASLPFTIKKGDLSSNNGTGTVTYDPKTGNIAESKMEMDVKGKLTIEIAGMETEVDLNQKQVSTLKTYYTDPLAKK
jgi:hypothetical protein